MGMYIHPNLKAETAHLDKMGWLKHSLAEQFIPDQPNLKGAEIDFQVCVDQGFYILIYCKGPLFDSLAIGYDYVEVFRWYQTYDSKEDTRVIRFYKVKKEAVWDYQPYLKEIHSKP